MKTTVKELDYEKVMALPQYPHLHPIRPGIFWRTLVRGLSILGLAGTHFHYTSEGMEKVGKNEPCLILMNHSASWICRSQAPFCTPDPTILSVHPTALWAWAA